MSIAEKLTLAAENVPKVYEAGKNDFRDEFEKWFTANGARGTYIRAFNETDFNGYTFKTTIKPKLIAKMFYNYKGTELPKNIDCSLSACSGNAESNSALATFSACAYITEIEDYKIPAQHTYYQTFAYCPKLKKIAVIRSNANTIYTITFEESNSLEDITFEGEIGRNINFQWSPLLTHDSLMSIINALVDYSEDNGGITYTLTLGANNIAKLSEEEIAIIENKGWNYA